MSKLDKQIEETTQETSAKDTSTSVKNAKENRNLQVGDVISKSQIFIEKNRKALIIALCAIVVVVIAICLYKFWYQPSQEKNAENEMFAAEYYFMQEDYTKALKGDGKHPGLIAISEDYSHTKTGKRAKYYLGIIYLSQGKYQQAIDNLEDFSPNDEFMASQSKSLLGSAYWEIGNIDKAIKCYKDAIKTNPNNFTTPDILMKLGAAYEVKKDYRQALDCYNTIKKDFPRSPEYAQIEKFIARMEVILNK